jgi:hypothetical protein
VVAKLIIHQVAERRLTWLSDFNDLSAGYREADIHENYATK